MNTRPIFYLALAASLLLPPASAVAAPQSAPANDSFGSAVTISSGSLPYTSPTIDVTDATVAGTDPFFQGCVNPNSQKHRTVWYKLTPASSGWLLVDTFGSGYDTVLGVWTGSAGSLNLVACDDDSSGEQSSAAAFVTQGVTYYFEVASYSAVLDPETENGTLTLHVGELPYVIYLPLVIGD